MSFDPNNMRSIMDIIESENSELNEAPLSSRIGRGLTKMKASLGNNKAKGVEQNDQLAKKMDDKWNVWLGQTGKKGTISDLQQFLVTKVGFNQSQANEILSQFGDGPIIQQGDTENSQDENQENAPEDNTQNQNDNADNSTEEAGEEQSAPENSETPPAEQPEGDSDQPSQESDDSAVSQINNSINTLDTYMTRSHLANIRPETVNKFLTNIKNIVNNLPKVSGSDRSRGANSALDAIAALEHAGSIPQVTANELQGYLRTAIRTEGDLQPFSPPVYDADAQDNNTTTPRNNQGNSEAPEPEQAPERPRVRVPAGSGRVNPTTSPDNQDEQSSQRPRIRVPAGTAQRNESVEYVFEDEDTALSAGEVYKIFKAASNYAYSNNIVGGNNTSAQQYNSGGYQQTGNSGTGSSTTSGTGTGYTSQSSGQGGRNGNSQSSDRKFTKHLGDVAEEAAKLGIDETRYSEIKEVAHKMSFEQIRGDDKATLSAIGYAFMRSM